MERDEIRICACGWKGRRDEHMTHPRQGFIVCPRCWRNGIERMTRTEAEWAEHERRWGLHGTEWER